MAVEPRRITATGCLARCGCAAAKEATSAAGGKSGREINLGFFFLVFSLCSHDILKRNIGW